MQQLYSTSSSSLLGAKQLAKEIKWQREHVGMIVLCSDGVQGLEIAQLEGCRGLVDHVCRLTKLGGSFLLSFGCYYLHAYTRGGGGVISY